MVQLYLYIVSKNSWNRFLIFSSLGKLLVMSEISDIFPILSKILNIFPKKIKNLKILMDFLETTVRYTWTKFQLPSLIFEEKIRTCVILRKSRFCKKNNQNLTNLVKISQILAFLPIRSPNFTMIHQSPLSKQGFEYLKSKNRKMWTKMTTF